MGTRLIVISCEMVRPLEMRMYKWMRGWHIPHMRFSAFSPMRRLVIPLQGDVYFSDAARKFCTDSDLYQRYIRGFA